MEIEEDIVLIAGPTASGKTSKAIEIAKSSGGVIINTDSMQVYRELRVITARPTAEEEAMAPHFLFGHVSGKESYSVAQWLADVSNLLDEPEINSGKIIFVGGTGLYFNSLLDGISPVPTVDPGIRTKWREASQSQSSELLHSHLQAIDPIMAEQLNANDTQRIIRALEVIESTGISLLDWQKKKGKPVLEKDRSVHTLLIMPERPILHERINQRFDQMVEEGGLKEVEELLELDLPEGSSLMKAIGVPQLAAHLRGELTIEEAIEQAKAATRQYAKRQCTWFNNSFDESWNLIS
ncbi:MAG: tRNA (adenosine(37)-N6)-dimethylallyltransferase MiaA [Pseudomonadota bacterium]